MLRRPPIAAVLVLLLAAVAPARADDAERRLVEQMEPAPLAPPRGARDGEVVPIRVRFHADADYRRGLARWQDRVRAQLAAVNAFLEPAFRVRLEGVEFKRWERASGSSKLDAIIEELERTDAGRDVDLVVGLVTALPLITSDIHQLGAARVLGRHMVLREMTSLNEAQALARSIDDGAAREALYSRRKRHKETAIFLHEWFHTLGAPHNTNAQRIMHPGHSHQVSTLSDAEAQLIALALDARIAARGRDAVDWAPMRAFVERTASPEWFPRDRDTLLSALRGGALPTDAPGPVARRRRATLPPEDVDGFNRAAALLNERKFDDAWGALDPIAARHPDDAEVARLACRLSHVRAAGARGEAACARAKELAPQAPETWIDAAQAHVLARRWDEALVETDTAAQRAAGAPPPLWGAIATLYTQIGALTKADEAVGRAGTSPEAQRAREAVERRRLMLGLPRAGGAFTLPPADEPAFARDVDRALELLDGRDRRAARTAVRALLDRHPAAPAVLALACELDIRDGNLRAGERRCAAAIAALDGYPRAHYLLGHIKHATGKTDAAVASLRRAIALDPRDRGPYELLGDVYRRGARKTDLTALQTEYQKTFGEPLRAGR